MNYKLRFITVFMLVLFVTSIYAQDWPQYLGPTRNSISPEKGILRSWPDSGPEVLWTTNLGIGYGGPVIKEGKIYLLDRDDQVGDIMRCFDLANGKELWKFGYDAPGTVMFPGSRSVPVVNGNFVYSCGHNGDLYCIDINTHKPVWNKNIWTDFGGEQLPVWAITQCPLVYGDLVVLLSQAPEAGAVAYNKLTGELAWKTPNLGNESYASPAVVKIDGQDHLVMVISSTNPVAHGDLEQTLGKIVGIDPQTGKVLWQYNQWKCHISVPSAVDAGNNRVLVVGGYELGAVMIKVEKQADGSYSTTELIRTEEFGDQTKPPILYNGYFYAEYGTNGRRDGMVCMSMDGEVKWKTRRSPDFNKGSMILADGLIIATDGSKTLYLVEPDPTEFKLLASHEILAEGGTSADGIAARVGGTTQNWAPLALAQGLLLIRDQKRLMCVKVVE
jgi:outer membrane protein assembly factor BamB